MGVVPARDPLESEVRHELSRASRLLLGRAGDRASARLEAELLLAEVLGLDRARLLTRGTLSDAERRAFAGLLQRRVRSAEPISQILGRRAFLDFELKVDRRVLTPRPESEELVTALKLLLDRGQVPQGPLADWGSGSGGLAVALSRWRPVLALERCPDARAVAARNLAELAGPAPTLLVGSDGLSALRRGCLAALVANPPYVEAREWPGLPDDVRLHEPRHALCPEQGSVRGLYSRLGAEARDCLVEGGWLLVELGAGQADGLEAVLAEQGLEPVSRRRDLAGHERVLVLRRP